MPAAYILNLMLVGAASLYLTKRVLKTVAPLNKKLHRGLSIGGHVLALLLATVCAVGASVSTYSATLFLQGSPNGYLSLRPTLGNGGLDCDPSEFWFGRNNPKH